MSITYILDKNVTLTNLHQIYHCIRKESTSDTKVFNSLAHSIKNLGDNPKQFKSVLKKYLYAHSSYSVAEYFNVNRES
jgi:hypothetical protein